jgi:hypothetical protein
VKLDAGTIQARYEEQCQRTLSKPSVRRVLQQLIKDDEIIATQDRAKESDKKKCNFYEIRPDDVS